MMTEMLRLYVRRSKIIFAFHAIKPKHKMDICCSLVSYYMTDGSTQGRRQMKTLLTINADQKLLETMFSIAICRQSKNMFITIFDLRSSISLTFSIVAYPLLDRFV